MTVLGWVGWFVLGGVLGLVLGGLVLRWVLGGSNWREGLMSLRRGGARQARERARRALSVGKTYGAVRLRRPAGS